MTGGALENVRSGTRRLLLVNPPPVGGVAFTRQGRCQEAEDVLGTAKPPYTLVLAAALLRSQGLPFAFADLTGEARTVQALAGDIARAGIPPDLIVFPSTTPTLRADAEAMETLRAAFPGARLVCFGPHASAAPADAMARVPWVDAMIVGEPEPTIVALAQGRAFGEIASVTWRNGGRVVAHTSRGVFDDFAAAPYPAWDLLDLRRYRVPLAGSPYVLVETSRGCPYACDFCVAPLHQGHLVRQRPARALVDEIETGRRTLGVRFFYLWADTVTLDQKGFSGFCDEMIARNLDVRWFGNARADSLVDRAFVRRLRQSGCWMLGIGVESASDVSRRRMLKRLADDEIRVAFANLRAEGIRSFAFFIFGYPGDTPEAMQAAVEYATEVGADFANFYPAVPYPGTALHARCVREGTLISDAWEKLDYSHYVLRDGVLHEEMVLDAIRKARRQFYLRPAYLVRHGLEALRLAATKPLFAARFMRALYGTRTARDRSGRDQLASTRM